MELVKYPDPRLRVPAKKITAVTPSLIEEGDQMMQIMKANQGIGLAAQQVGLTSRMIAIDTTLIDKTHGFKGVLWNPEIVKRSPQTVMFTEGCLSFDNVSTITCRSSQIVVRYLSEDNSAQLMMMNGITAICTQHEIDHLDGILFIDFDLK